MAKKSPQRSVRSPAAPLQNWKVAAESYIQQEDGSEARLAALSAEEQENAMRYLVNKFSHKRPIPPRDAESLRATLAAAPRGFDIALGAAVLGSGFDVDALNFIEAGVAEYVPRAVITQVAKIVAPSNRSSVLWALIREIATRDARVAALELITIWLQSRHDGDWPHKPGGTVELHSILVAGTQDLLHTAEAQPFWQAYTRKVAPASLNAAPEWRTVMRSLENRDGVPRVVKEAISAFLKEGRESDATTQVSLERTPEASSSTNLLIVAGSTEDASLGSAADASDPEGVGASATSPSLSAPVVAPPVATVEPTPQSPQPPTPSLPSIQAPAPTEPLPTSGTSLNTAREAQVAPPPIEQVEDRAGYVQRLRAGRLSIEKLASFLDESEKVHQQLVDARKQFELLRRKFSAGEEQREGLEGQNAELKRRIVTLEEQVRAASQRVATVEASLRHERSEVFRFRDLLSPREDELNRASQRIDAQALEVENLRALLKKKETQLAEAHDEAAAIRADRDRIASQHDENICAERRLTRESVLAELRGRIENVLRFEFEEAERFASSEDEKESLQRLGKALRESTKIS